MCFEKDSTPALLEILKQNDEMIGKSDNQSQIKTTHTITRPSLWTVLVWEPEWVQAGFSLDEWLSLVSKCDRRTESSHPVCLSSEAKFAILTHRSQPLSSQCAKRNIPRAFWYFLNPWLQSRKMGWMFTHSKIGWSSGRTKCRICGGQTRARNHSSRSLYGSIGISLLDVLYAKGAVYVASNYLVVPAAGWLDTADPRARKQTGTIWNAVCWGQHSYCLPCAHTCTHARTSARMRACLRKHSLGRIPDTQLNILFHAYEYISMICDFKKITKMMQAD